MKKIDLNQLFETIGHNLNIIRTARKETLEGVAESVESTHSALSKIENGRYPGLSLSLLVKLCNHYEITLQQVLGLDAIQIFQCLQNNSEGSTGNILKQVANEVSEGFHVALDQYKSEVDYLRNQVEHLRNLLENTNANNDSLPIKITKGETRKKSSGKS